ncbi:MAG TPA: multidrug efflux RND transporter permease subunit [Steroidobacter sp.]|jgi:multidrug efflux pump|nr:multidrug efflux RND transporter permease subunit [Steroidobacter sp.]
MPNFFISRPIFAWVIAILIAIGGAFAFATLPVESYPTVAPPQVQVSMTYPGANAETIETTVTQVIEQQLKGIDGLLYFTSSSSSTGQAAITLTFRSGTDPDIAVVQTQNRVAQGEPRLPSDVVRQGISVQKVNPSMLMVVTLTSKDGGVDRNHLNDFVATHVVDSIQRLPGVGLVLHFGYELGMRIWLDPGKLQAFGMSAAHVMDTVRNQNVQFASGEIGARPAVPGQQFTATVAAEGRFTSPEQFEQIILRADPGGAAVRLKDVARVEYGPQTYSLEAREEAGSTGAFGVQTLPNANALEVGEAVRQKMAELASTFPPGVTWKVSHDTTQYIRIAIKEVVYTLIQAVVLVFLVMLLFLQSFRATLIPTLVVPVALLGAALAMNALGFSINQLTLFAMVLAIGIVVDDAIVVIEATERIMREENLSPMQATRKAMSQITNAIIAITVVLSAVFVPAALQGGTVGGIYRQFALVIALSMLFSAFLALSLTPALCATILRPTHMNNVLFGRFNDAFARSQTAYIQTLASSLRHTPRWMASFIALVLVAALLYARLPTSFVPEEDIGMFIGIVELPPGATLDRTVGTLDRAGKLLENNENVTFSTRVAGFSFIGQGENMGQMFVRLKHWDERKQTAQELIPWAFANVSSQIHDARVLFISPPTIAGLGQFGGFDFFLEDRVGLGRPALNQALQTLLQEAGKDPALAHVRTNTPQPSPRLKLTIDRVQAEALGVRVTDVYSAIQLMLAPVYVNDFFNEGRVRRVVMQADAPFRMTPAAFENFYLPSTRDVGESKMVPLSSLVHTQWEVAPPTLSHFNGYPAIQLTGQAAPGFSSGEAMNAMERIVRERLPRGVSSDWAGQALQERLSGTQSPLLFGTSLLIVFLCLAALYESWSTPIAVMLIVPLGLLGAVLAVNLRGLPNDIFFKVGLITIIGLSAKNAILIVEYALAQQTQGKTLYQAVLEASRLRLRPILMTSFAFILGVLPLVVSTGAGANARRAIGTGVAGGMLAAAFLGVLLVPVFYVVVRRLLRDTLDEVRIPAGHTAPVSDSPSHGGS